MNKTYTRYEVDNKDLTLAFLLEHAKREKIPLDAVIDISESERWAGIHVNFTWEIKMTHVALMCPESGIVQFVGGASNHAEAIRKWLGYNDEIDHAVNAYTLTKDQAEALSEWHVVGMKGVCPIDNMHYEFFNQESIARIMNFDRVTALENAIATPSSQSESDLAAAMHQNNQP